MAKQSKEKKDKVASDYLADWSNNKIKFEDALKDFAAYHVKQALQTVADQTGQPIEYDFTVIQ